MPDTFPELEDVQDDDVVEIVAPPPTEPTDSHLMPEEATLTTPPPAAPIPPLGANGANGGAAAPQQAPPPPGVAAESPGAPAVLIEDDGTRRVEGASINSKAGATLLGGAIVTVGLSLLSQFAGFDPEPAVVASLTTVMAFALAWLVPEKWWWKSKRRIG